MEMKLTDWLPWWKVTSTYIMSLNKEVSYIQRRKLSYIECIFYFDNTTQDEVENIYNGLKKGHEQGIFNEFDVIEHPMYDSIIIRKWRKQENKKEENILCWKRHNDPDRYYESYTIDEYDDGRKVLCRGEYEISINELEKLPKIK